MKWLVVSLAVLASLACGGEAPSSNGDSNSDNQKPRGTRTSDVRKDTATESDRGGVDVFDASTVMRREPSVQHADASAGAGGAHKRDAGAPQRARDAGKPSQPTRSSPLLDAAAPRSDAASDLDAGAEKDASSKVDAGRSEDAGVAVVMNHGSCCNVSSHPGCGDPALQACVCAQYASCCKEAWTEACTRIVAEKFCQSGVRECVCGKGAGQWQQTQCCESTWDDTCESVATNKCGATSACESK